MLLTLILLVGVAGRSWADQRYEDTGLEAGESRFLYFNSSSTATAITLLGALILLGVIFYIVYIGNIFKSPASSSYAYNKNDYYSQYDPYSQARSADGGWDLLGGANVLQWISMMQEVYEKFDYNDLECQKRLICEVLQEPEYFGQVAKNMKTGFQFAKYLEVLNMPDDFREILDEYMDASDRSLGKKECGEVFECPYSLKEAVKRNFSGNSL